MGSAEVTLVFDNTDNQLEEALPEVALKLNNYIAMVIVNSLLITEPVD